MPVLLTQSWWASQPEATDTAPEVGAPQSGPPQPPGCAGASTQFVVLGLMFGLFYFLLIRPQQKRQREVDDMLKSLRRGDKVRTSGGIRGEILDLTDTEVTLLIADKVKINVLRANVSSRIERQASDAKAG